MATTNIDNNDLVIGNARFEDDTFTFGAGATYVAGTILARDSSTKKYVLYVKGGSTNGNGIPKAALTYSITKGASGDLPVRVLIGGEVVTSKLVIAADGNASNIDGIVRDQLRAQGIMPQTVTAFSGLDNQ